MLIEIPLAIVDILSRLNKLLNPVHLLDADRPSILSTAANVGGDAFEIFVSWQFYKIIEHYFQRQEQLATQATSQTPPVI